MTESIGESQVIQYLLELAKYNSIYLLSFEKPAEKNKFLPMMKRLNNANIQWKYFEYSNRFGILSSFSQISLAFLFLAKWVKKEKIQIIHSRSYIPAMVGLLLKKIFKVKLLFDIRGFGVDEKIMHGRLKEGSLLTYCLKKLELSLYKNSDHIVTLTHVSKSIIEDKFHVNPVNISIIPTCANLELFKPKSTAEKAALRKEAGFSPQDIIILRNGSLNGSYDLDAEFKLFEQLALLDNNIKILFLNQGHHKDIQYYLDKYKIDKKICKIISVDFHEVSSYISLADLCVFFVIPSFAKQASAPTKFAEIVACHLPAVTNTKYGDMEYYFNSYKVGILLDLDEIHSNPKKSAEKVMVYLKIKNKQNNDFEFDNLFQSYFSKQIAVERYQQLYSVLAPENRHD